MRTALALVLVSLLLAAVNETVKQRQQRIQLTERIASQQQLVADAEPLRRQLDNLAAGTARLAATGNAHAAAVLKQIEQAGIRIRKPTPEAP